jgi:dynein heavy chain
MHPSSSLYLRSARVATGAAAAALTSRLFSVGAGPLVNRLSRASPVPPRLPSGGGGDALGATTVSEHMEPSLVPRVRSLGKSKSGAMLGGGGGGGSLVALRASHPLMASPSVAAALAQAATRSSEELAATAERERAAIPARLARGYMSHTSLPPPRAAGSGSGALPPRRYAETKDTPSKAGEESSPLGASRASAAAAAASPPAPRSFVESLHLDARAMDELVTGNFLYLRPKPGAERSAYDLAVVEHWDVDMRDYYTMSRSGVTHFVGNDSEFTSLEQWEREYGLFNRIRSIPFFAKYNIWKNFTVWKKTVRGGKARIASKALTDGLFFLNPTLRISLMRLRRLCFEVSRWRLFEAAPSKTYNLEEFCDEQAVKRHHIASWLSQFSDDVRALVRGACDEVLDKFLADNGIKADHKMTFMERAALRTECRKLTKYIRLADFLVTDTLMALALDSTAALRDLVKPAVLPPRKILLEEEPKAKVVIATAHKQKEALVPVPLLRVVVAFESAHAAPPPPAPEDAGGDAPPAPEDEVTLTVSPSLADVKARLRALLLEGMGIISAPPRLITHDDLSPYTQAASDDAEEGGGDEVELGEVVTGDAHFVATSTGMFDALDEAFQDVADYCRVFAPFKATFLRNEDETTNIEAQFRGVELSVFQDAIAKYQGQATQFNTIPRMADIGIIRADSVDLKQMLMPSPVACLFAIRKLLPELMTEHCELLHDDVRALYTVVASAPDNAADFVKKLSYLSKTQVALPGLRERREHIDAMAELMTSNNWPIPDTNKAHLNLLRDALSRLETETQASESRLDEDVKRFAAEVDAAVPVLKKNVLAVRERLDDAMIGDADADPRAVIRHLTACDDEMRKLKDTSLKYQSYQRDLRVPEQEVCACVCVRVRVCVRVCSARASLVLGRPHA